MMISQVSISCWGAGELNGPPSSGCSAFNCKG
jgi:hypothetical protein